MTFMSATSGDAVEGRVPAPAISSLGSGEIAGLDGMRAISVLMVMIGHFGFGNILPGGLGVTVFFFISGFLITTLLLREQARTGRIAIGQFYLRRLLRLQPELWAMILISTFAGTIYSVWVWPRLIDLGAALFYFTNYLYVGALTTDIPGNLRWPHLWSLAIEEHYYLTYPLLFILLIRTPARFIKVLAALCIVELAYRLYLSHHGVDDHYLYAATEARLDSIAYGCFTALSLWYLPAWMSAWIRRFGYLLIVASVVLLGVSLLLRDPAFRETWRYSVQGVALTLGFAGLYGWPGGPTLTGVLEFPLLKWLGRMSYGAYLWHLEVSRGLSVVFGLGLYETPSLNAAVTAALYTVATFAVAALSYELLQKPLIAWRHRLGSPTRAVAAE